MDNEKRELIKSTIEYLIGRTVEMDWFAGGTSIYFYGTIKVDNMLFHDNLLLTCCNVADDLSRLSF